MSEFSKVRVFVAGDLMLDRFEYGKVSRISPEAPVPVFRFEREKRMLGGVGNVAANLVALGCKVTLSGLVGRDASGAEVARLLKAAGIASVLVRSAKVPTTIKTRLIAGNNHLLRADQESDAGAASLSAAVLPRIDRAIAKADVTLLSDYAKGFLSAATCICTPAAPTDERIPAPSAPITAASATTSPSSPTITATIPRSRPCASIRTPAFR